MGSPDCVTVLTFIFRSVFVSEGQCGSAAPGVLELRQMTELIGWWEKQSPEIACGSEDLDC